MPGFESLTLTNWSVMVPWIWTCICEGGEDHCGHQHVEDDGKTRGPGPHHSPQDKIVSLLMLMKQCG